MKISQILKDRPTITIKAEACVSELVNLLAKKKIGAVVVSPDAKKIIGIVSERDVIHALAEHGTSTMTLKVSEIMTSEVITCRPDQTIAQLMETMTNSRIRHVPVVNENNELTSLVSIGDIVKSHISDLDTERQALSDYVRSSIS
jgi:CBS domain-containing protein